ncbi:MAG TPA: MMPL family transporter [Solirubrobacteraceae bacterium]|nr:MMPL family transporter [Solirubrobacteraceae bacterium]
MFVGWIVTLVVTLGLSSALGTKYSNNFSLGGTESQRATDLLKREFAAQAGDQDTIVLRAKDGKVTSAAVRDRVQPVLDKIERLPHVTGVTSPFDKAGAAQVAKDGRIAFATVTFDQRANDLDKADIQRVIDTATTARSSTLQVELGGQAIEQAQQVSLGFVTVVGLAAAIIVLLITFGSALAMGLPIITALLGLGTGIALLGMASHLVDMADFSTELATMIGLGVGIDYALFIVTRFREEHGNGSSVRDAVISTMDSAGRAVLFAGATVIIALLGMFALGVNFLYGVAIGAAIAVALVMLASLTVLPALLSRFGERLARPRRRRRAAPAAPTGGFWRRWSGIVERRPWPAAIAGVAIMVVLAAPALSMHMGTGDQGNDPTSNTTRRAYDLLSEGFGKGFNGPLLVVAQLPRQGDTGALDRIGQSLKSTPGVASVAPARVSPSGDTATFSVYPRTSPQDTKTNDLVKSLRDDQLPAVERATHTTLLVGGATATSIDFSQVLANKLPLFIAIVVGLSALLLLVVFRSLVIPVQGAVMNLLSIGASLGVTVLVFQQGWLAGVLGVQEGPIEPWLPVMLFAIVFGLSMDYEVFLVSRIHEEWTKRRDAHAAVREGLALTGRVITAAATIMICVFLSFVLGDDRAIKLFGFSLATAVFLDAFVVRSLLLPAVLHLLGRTTWALPGWLERRLPNIAIERPSAPEPQRPLEPAFEEGA